ncbi:DUF4391 domain-containing protein [Brachybacterium tyrofermentans]|uniref:DUF4391 domain-containing protein n=1 Tax=Brachybacterium tyrofermentans TaxID=47848 RepID=UPI003FD3A7AB
MTEPVLYLWPPAAKFGRVVPKTKFYEHGNVRTALHKKFVDDIQRITWAYKLAGDTIRLHGTAAVPEIQVFIVEAKGADVSDDVLTAIDRTVHFPIVFEITGGDRVRTVAAQKTLGGKAPSIGAYYSSGWLPADAERQPLPTSIDLNGLYEKILSALLPMDVRAGETASEATGRLDRAQRLQREIAALGRKLRTEPQLNRKIELRRQLKERTVVLTELTGATPSD